MKSSVAQQAERGLLGVFMFGILWAPLPLAGNRPWAMAVLALFWWSLLAAVLWLKSVPRTVREPAARRGGRSTLRQVWPSWPFQLRGAWPVLALLVGFCAWVAVQGAGGLGGTADAQETRLYLYLCLAYTAAFAATLLLFDTDLRRTLLFHAILAAGVVQALLAIMLLAEGGQYDFMGMPVHHGGRALGTFANADHLAHYMALTLSAGVGLMLSSLSGSPRRMVEPGWRGFLRTALEFMLSGKMVIRLLLVVLVIVLVLTRSRMGNGSFFLSLFVLGGWLVITSAKLRKPAAILVTSLLIVDLIVIGQWVGLEKVVQRLEATEIARDSEAPGPVVNAASAANGAIVIVDRPHREESLEERVRPAVDTLKAIALRPWTGSGGGTFFIVFPQVKRAELESRFDHAHDDYAEIAAETGLPGLLMLGGVFALTLWRVLRLLRDDQPGVRRGLSVGIAMAMLCAFLHAWVDFNLQIPANALTLTVLLAAAWSTPVSRAPARSKYRGDAPLNDSPTIL